MSASTVEELFGEVSSSDEDNEVAENEKKAATEEVPAESVTSATMTQLFGSDSDDDDADGKQEVKDDATIRRVEAVEEDFRIRERIVAKGRPQTIAPRTRMEQFSNTDELFALKLPDMADLEQQEFREDSYEPRTDSVGCDSVIRWRHTVNEQGERVPESNAHIIVWEDGSTHLCIGDDMFSMAKKTNVLDQEFLFSALEDSNGQNVEECVAQVKGNVVCTPVVGANAKYADYQKRVSRKHVQPSKVRTTVSRDNQAYEYEEMQRRAKEAESKAMREKTERQRKELQRKRGGQFSKHFLEDGLDTEEQYANIENEEDDGERLLQAQQLDEDEDTEGEDIAASSDDDQRRGVKRKLVEEEEDDDDDMADFIDDDEQEIQISRKSNKKAKLASDSDSEATE